MKLELDLSAKILNDLDSFIKNVNAILSDFGINENVKKLSEIESILKRIRLLKPSQNYLGVTLDSNGYIVDINPLHDFVLEQGVPEDVLRGYYKIKDGVLYLDKERQALLWRNE